VPPKDPSHPAPSRRVGGVVFTRATRSLRQRRQRKNDQRWIAQWQENHKQKEKGFPVRKYGFEEAKRLAIEYRKTMVSKKES
jgi:hypothetical protein